MKKIFLSFVILIFGLVSFSFAERVLNMWEFLTIYFEWISKDIPESWKYIDVKYKNIGRSTPLYQSLQKGIYLDIFPNLNQELAKEKIIKQEHVVKLLQAKIKKDFKFEKWKDITVDWTKYMIDYTQKEYVWNKWLETAQLILDDVISRLDQEYIFEKNFDKEKLWYGAIKWYVDALWDPYTVFMTPSEAKTFGEDLEWSFEWIGAQLEMKWDWNFVIISPLKNSPAEKYWVLAWDIILKVDDKEVKNNTSLNELISWIKWPAETFVKLNIKRGNEIKILNIKRWKIILANVDHELLEWLNCYISIAQFNYQTMIQFKNAINFFENKKCDKYIMDVRNNPGWDLNVVSNMLDYFVSPWETIATIKYKNMEQDIVASNNTKKILDKNMIVLINKGSASASEIFAWVIKDYVKNTILLWTQTFGKWSVQSVVEYTDGSMLKYTVAKRFTGWSKKNINLEWISPDLRLEDDPKTARDEVLDVAKIYKFK